MTDRERQTLYELLDREIIPRLKRIEHQVTTTNGRVTALEHERDVRAGYEQRVSEETAIDRSDRWSWRGLVIPACVSIFTALLVIAVAHVWPV
jgi:hypothetical protein